MTNTLDLTRCKPGDQAFLDVELDEAFVEAFATYSGDRNPLHVDAKYAETTRFKRRVAHGMSYAAMFSQLIGMKLPGPGALWMGQSFRFARPAFLGDKIRLSVEVAAISESARTVTLDCRAVNQLGEKIMTGTGEVLLGSLGVYSFSEEMTHTVDLSAAWATDLCKCPEGSPT